MVSIVRHNVRTDGLTFFNGELLHNAYYSELCALFRTAS